MSSDPLPVLLNLVFIILLVLLNAFFVAVEFALVKVRSSRIDTLAEEGHRNAKFTKRILNNLDAYLSACQLGITLASLVLGWLGESTIAALIEPLFLKLGLNEIVIHTVSFIISFTLMTFLHITLGEQYPKTYAIRKSESVSLWASGPMILFYKIAYPFIWILNGSSHWLLRRSGIEPSAEHAQAHTEEEIRILMKESNKSGLIDNNELTLVDNIFEFSDTTAREIMIPRTEMTCLNANLSYEDNKEIAINEMHTRYPICETDKDNIVGFVHMKDLLKSSEVDDIRAIIRPILSVPESIQISNLLKSMQKRRTQMALLIDEYGGTSGLVTIEDILEEIVGEIQDEFDEERPSIEKKDEYTHSIDGLLLIDEFNDFFGMDIQDENYDTIGGWLYSRIEIPPKKNQKIIHDDQFEFVIEETDNMRISRVVFRKFKTEPKKAVV